MGQRSPHIRYLRSNRAIIGLGEDNRQIIAQQRAAPHLRHQIGAVTDPKALHSAGIIENPPPVRIGVKSCGARMIGCTSVTLGYAVRTAGCERCMKCVTAANCNARSTAKSASSAVGKTPLRTAASRTVPDRLVGCANLASRQRTI
jgi:hypothetical protein